MPAGAEFFIHGSSIAQGRGEFTFLGNAVFKKGKLDRINGIRKKTEGEPHRQKGRS
jgi:hypothetical protein